MILEVAVLDVIPGREAEFESAFRTAASILEASPGYLTHQLNHCLEAPSRYLLMVQWTTLEAHTQGFRGSPAYARWRELLHHFYDPFPKVEHYVALGEAR